MEPADLDTETYETIPWSHLAPARTPLLTRVGAALTAVVVTAVLTFVLVSVLRDEPAGVVVTIPGAAMSDGPAAESPQPPVSTTMAPAAIATPEPATLFTEADLMAVIPEEEQRLAVAYAEWFLTDYFTVDGDALAAERLRAMLPVGMDVVLPHDGATGVSYVEWASAIAVRPDGPGRYSVDVAFQTLAGAGDGTLVRQPARAARIPILVTEAGLVSVGDLPEPIAVPATAADFVAPPSDDPPPEVGAAAVEAASTFGAAGELIDAGIDASGWRVVIAVRDSSGISFPFAVRP